jgi:hypothetical protein
MSAVFEEMTDGIVIGMWKEYPAPNKALNPCSDYLQEIRRNTLASVLRHFEIVELWQQCVDQMMQSTSLESALSSSTCKLRLPLLNRSRAASYSSSEPDSPAPPGDRPAGFHRQYLAR